MCIHKCIYYFIQQGFVTLRINVIMEISLVRILPSAGEIPKMQVNLPFFFFIFKGLLASEKLFVVSPGEGGGSDKLSPPLLWLN